MHISLGLFLLLGVHSHAEMTNGDQVIPDSVANTIVTDIVSQAEVDLLKFSGVWYEVARSPYATEYAHVKSVIRYMMLGPDINSLTGYYTGTVNGTCLPAFKGHIQKICPEGAGDFFARGITMATGWGFTKLIYTDYKTAVLYFCPAVNENGTCKKGRYMASILSREKTVTPEVELFLKETLENSTGIPMEDLLPAEYENDCFHKVIAAMTEDVGNDSCVFDDFPTQTDFDVEKFSGKWYPIAAQRFVPRPELLNYPLCYGSNGDGSLSVQFVTLQEDQCHTTDPFMIVPRCPSEHTGDFVVNRGLSVFKQQLIFSKFKVLYTDYEVAVGLGCFGTDTEGVCAEKFTGVAILSRTASVSREKREFLNDIARRHCVDMESLKDIELNENIEACGCPENKGDNKGLKSVDTSNDLAEGTKNFPAYDADFLSEKMLGTWYDLATTPESAATFLPGFSSFISTYFVGPRGDLRVTTTMARNGTCIPPWTALIHPVCDTDRPSQWAFSYALLTSWYLSRIIYIDDELVVAAPCASLTNCDDVDETNLRVAARTMGWSDVIEATLDSVLGELGLGNASSLVPTAFDADCSGHMLDSPDQSDSSNCLTRNFPVHENFTVSKIAGTWHVLAHYSHMNGSTTDLSSGVVHYQQNNGSLSALVTGSNQDGGCLPLLRFKVHPRCDLAADGEMWTEEVESIFTEGAPQRISATWKTIYLDEESAVVYNCKKETMAGDCDIDNARLSIMVRNFNISAEKETFLRDQASRTCVDSANLWNMTSSTPDECSSVLEKALVEVEE